VQSAREFLVFRWGNSIFSSSHCKFFKFTLKRFSQFFRQIKNFFSKDIRLFTFSLFSLWAKRKRKWMVSVWDISTKFEGKKLKKGKCFSGELNFERDGSNKNLWHETILNISWKQTLNNSLYKKETIISFEKKFSGFFFVSKGLNDFLHFKLPLLEFIKETN